MRERQAAGFQVNMVRHGMKEEEYADHFRQFINPEPLPPEMLDGHPANVLAKFNDMINRSNSLTYR